MPLTNASHFGHKDGNKELAAQVRQQQANQELAALTQQHTQQGADVNFFQEVAQARHFPPQHLLTEPETMSPGRRITKLDLQNCGRIGQIQGGLQALVQCPALSIIGLGDNEDGVQKIAGVVQRCPALAQLNLRFNQIARRAVNLMIPLVQ